MPLPSCSKQKAAPSFLPITQINSARQPAPKSWCYELVVLELAKAGKISLADSVWVSRRAARTGGSQVFLKQGEVFTLRELMEAAAIFLS